MSKPNARTDFPASMTTPVLTTTRLLLRPPRPSDAASFFAFLSDPAAMHFTHCHASVRECRRRLGAFEWQRRRTGLGHGDDLNQKLIQAAGDPALLMQSRHKENGG